MDYKTPEYVDGELAKNHFFCESKGLAIIDCMMNLPLLFWADEEKLPDTSAAAVVLSAILEIERYKTDSKLQKYKRLLIEKLEEYVNYDENVMGILRGQNGRNVYTSFGDYYLIESHIKDKMSIKVW